MASKTSTDSETTESTETVASTSSTAKRMGVVRFLQLEPQRSGIAAILRRRYASEVHTLAEWETLVQNVLNRKVK